MQKFKFFTIELFPPLPFECCRGGRVAFQLSGVAKCFFQWGPASFLIKQRWNVVELKHALRCSKQILSTHVELLPTSHLGQPTRDNPPLIFNSQTQRGFFLRQLTEALILSVLLNSQFSTNHLSFLSPCFHSAARRSCAPAFTCKSLTDCLGALFESKSK